MALTVDFGAKDSLITSQEVIDNTPVSGSSVPSMRTHFIAMKEEKLFRKCFGWEFYLALMADKVSYKLSGGDETYTAFREGVNYSVGDFLLHEGRLYEVTKVTTGTQRPSLEVQNEYFKLAPKFHSPEYNYLWERYLKGIIAFSITESSLLYRAIQDTAKGLVKKYDEGQTQNANIREVYALKSDYAGDIGDLIRNMEDFILENKDLDVFSKYKAIAAPCESGCQSRRRHYGFNTN
jgi:hypothetical protein